MSIVDFLRKRFAYTGFDALSHEEVEGVRDFMLLWSSFEAEMLHSNAGAKVIADLAKDLEACGKLNSEPFAAAEDYFRNRYWQAGKLSAYAYDLRLDRYQPKWRSLAEEFISGVGRSAGDRTAGLLLVIYRLRNNMFHGPKWAYGIQGQLDNFRAANSVLMTVLEL